MSVQLKIMSFNMRYDNAADGENAFPHRRERILDCLDEARADVIGFQEITPAMRAWLVESLTDYYTVGGARNANHTGEASLIAFRKDSLVLLSCDTLMLSSTPRVLGSRYDGSDQSGCPRVYTRVCLKHRDIAEPFYVYNVHTDHKGSVARALASSQLLQDITSHGAPFFMTGDFNATPDAPEIQMITACRARAIVDATADIGGTFHGFGALETPTKIDYIFTDAAIKTIAAACIDDNPAASRPYISDHYPIYIIAEM